MSQRSSGYDRKDRDLYETPQWVTDVLLRFLPNNLRIWEPAAGSGKMADALALRGHDVVRTDLSTGQDFLSPDLPAPFGIDGVVTNPPFNLAQQFIERSLNVTQSNGGFVAMLLRTDFDHAKTRQHLFGRCKQFCDKIVLTKRIVWFEKPGAAPSYNHAWFIWNWKNENLPKIRYQA